MRVCLARALFADADVLLLDEPTNHLDLKAINWLTAYLTGDSKTLGGENALRLAKDKIVIVVSHSRDFLNDVRGHPNKYAWSKKYALLITLTLQNRQHSASIHLCVG